MPSAREMLALAAIAIGLLVPTHGVAAVPTGTFTAVDSGADHACAIKTDSSIECWGNDDLGQATPRPGTFDAVSAGDKHTCAIRTDGTLTCWGRNAAGEGSPPTGTFTSVAAGYGRDNGDEPRDEAHTCALRSDATVACWGSNTFGQAGPPDGEFAMISAGALYTCGLRLNGTVACWGHRIERFHTEGTFDVFEVFSGHACGVRSDRTIGCFGDDTWGQRQAPPGTFDSVTVGRLHSCGVRSDRTVACWGDDTDGQATPATGSFTAVSAGRYHTCGVRTGGAIDCWGWLPNPNQPQVLTVTKEGDGEGTVTSSPQGINCGPTCEATFPRGTTVTLTPTPAVGSRFAYWNSAICGWKQTCTVTMDISRAITGTFTRDRHELSIQRLGNGTGTVVSEPAGIECGATCQATFPHGTSVRLLATSDAGSSSTWSAPCSGSGECILPMHSPRTVTVTFTLHRYPLTVSRDGSGSGTVTSSPAGITCGSSCTALYDHGTTVVLEAESDLLSTFAGWSGACTNATGPCEVSMSAASSVVATFIFDPVGWLLGQSPLPAR